MAVASSQKKASQKSAPAPAGSAAKGAPHPAAAKKDEGYAAAAAHLMPGGGADAKLAPGELNAAVRYNDGRGFQPARWRAIQKTVGAKVDGDPGPDTARHVAGWQGGHSLEVDGKVGPRTLSSVQAAGGKDDKKDDKPGDEKPAKPGGGGGKPDKAAQLSPAEIAAAVSYNEDSNFTSDQIRKVQAKVGAKVDGDMGPDTVRHIAVFQAKNGLEVDGKIGPRTANLLGVQRGAGSAKGPNAEKLQAAMARARAMGLVITSTTGGKHTKGSYHYKARAFDCAGSAKQMNAFFWEMVPTKPTELFYDPAGMVKYGHYSKRAIGGHDDHVHVAY